MREHTIDGTLQEGVNDEEGRRRVRLPGDRHRLECLGLGVLGGEHGGEALPTRNGDVDELAELVDHLLRASLRRRRCHRIAHRRHLRRSRRVE